MRSLVASYIVQEKMQREQYSAAIAKANHFLANSPDDALWLNCNVQKVLAYTALNDFAHAQTTYQSMQSRAVLLDSTMIENLQQLLTNLSLSGNKVEGKSVSEQNGTREVTSKPTSFMLHQNYPNPFNPVTIIRYELPSNSIVSLKIYDILGREVSSLLNNIELEEGQYETEFDANKFASGIYFYRLDVVGENGATFSSIRKMMLIK